MSFNRRHTLGLLGAGALVAGAGLPRVGFAAVETDKRFVMILLRGAMDGLAAVPAFGDPDFERERNGIALRAPGEAGGALPLDSFFGLNPWLPTLHKAWGEKQLIAVHAIATPYRERSHFDAQNLLENGSAQPYGLPDGWLNRALADLKPAGSEIGVSITPSVPVIMRGASPVSTWSPSELPAPDQGLIARAEMLYARDAALSDAFAKARAANSMMTGGGDGLGFVTRMAGAARFLKDPNGPRVAFLESPGWDTHAGQSATDGPLHAVMRSLNTGLETLREGLGPVWEQTAVLIVTEFGRTVAMNGSNGTDHGTGGAAFLLGGAVNGGRVIADWPGLKKAQQHEGRDLKPTTDMRALMKGVMIEHLGITEARLERDAFPNSAAVKPLTGLIRA